MIVTVRKTINLAAGLWSLVVNAVFLLSVWVPPHWNNFNCFILTSGGQSSICIFLPVAEMETLFVSLLSFCLYFFSVCPVLGGLSSLIPLQCILLCSRCHVLFLGSLFIRSRVSLHY